MRLRWVPLAILCVYATAVLVATPTHLAADHASDADSGHEHDDATQESGHDHPAIEHELTGVKAPSGVYALVPEDCASLIPHVPTDEFVFVPPETPPRLLFFASHFAPRAPPAL